MFLPKVSYETQYGEPLDVENMAHPLPGQDAYHRIETPRMEIAVDQDALDIVGEKEDMTARRSCVAVWVRKKVFGSGSVNHFFAF